MGDKKKEVREVAFYDFVENYGDDEEAYLYENLNNNETINDYGEIERLLDDGSYVDFIEFLSLKYNTSIETIQRVVGYVDRYGVTQSQIQDYFENKCIILDKSMDSIEYAPSNFEDFYGLSEQEIETSSDFLYIEEEFEVEKIETQDTVIYLLLGI